MIPRFSTALLFANRAFDGTVERGAARRGVQNQRWKWGQLFAEVLAKVFADGEHFGEYLRPLRAPETLGIRVPWWWPDEPDYPPSTYSFG